MADVRRHVIMSEDVDGRLSAFARERRRGRGAAIEILFEERDGNFGKLRHDLRGKLWSIDTAAAEVLAGTAPVDDQMRKIQQLVEECEQLLAKT